MNLGNTFGAYVGSQTGEQGTSDDPTSPYDLAQRAAQTQRGDSFDINNPLGALGSSQAQVNQTVPGGWGQPARNPLATNWQGDLSNQQTNDTAPSQIHSANLTDGPAPLDTTTTPPELEAAELPISALSVPLEPSAAALPTHEEIQQAWHDFNAMLDAGTQLVNGVVDFFGNGMTFLASGRVKPEDPQPGDTLWYIDDEFYIFYGTLDGQATPIGVVDQSGKYALMYGYRVPLDEFKQQANKGEPSIGWRDWAERAEKEDKFNKDPTSVLDGKGTLSPGKMPTAGYKKGNQEELAKVGEGFVHGGEIIIAAAPGPISARGIGNGTQGAKKATDQGNSIAKNRKIGRQGEISSNTKKVTVHGDFSRMGAAWPAKLAWMADCR